MDLGENLILPESVEQLINTEEEIFVSIIDAV